MSTSAGEQEFVHADSVRSGIKTDNGSGLQIGDRIVAVDDTPVIRPVELRELQRALPRMVGQYAESQEWAAQGKAEGTPLRLRVRRRVSPGEGWVELDIIGTLFCERTWSNAAQRRLFGPSGPECMGRDGFDDGWASWYEKRVFEWERILDGGWQSSLQTRSALANHLEHKPRVDALIDKYPGPFARSVRDDWELVKRCLEGDQVTLPADALAFRTLKDERSKRIAERAAEDWKTAQAVRAEQILASFPAIDPFRDDRSAVTGKLVVPPKVTQRDWLVDMGKAYLAWNEANHWIFAPIESPAMWRIFGAVRRYEKQVAPGVRMDVELIGRLLPNPRLLAGSGRTAAGLEVEPIVALVGGVVCVDASVEVDGRSAFAGEESLAQDTEGLPADKATPQQVIEAMIAAIKRTDQITWTGLFAEWHAVPDESRPIWYPLYPWNGSDEDWLRSRRLLLDTVLDARVRWVGEPRVIIRGDEAPGLPRIEQVEVEIDHVGQFDGETRVFNSVAVHRRWLLQRRAGGPWRIASRQSL